MKRIRAHIKNIAYTFVSLTNTQNVFSRFFRAADFLPEISLPRFACGGGVPIDQVRTLYHHIPSLSSKPWTEYWINVGEEFERKENHRAACMSFIMGAFPKEDRPWKARCNKLRQKSFIQWCKEKDFHFKPRVVHSVFGPVHYYLYIPEGHKHRVPVTLFVNGLEGSAEEIGFPLLKFKNDGVAFAIASVPGGVDSPIPMSTDSEKLLKVIFDDLEKEPALDPEQMGIVGFSFGAFWSLMATKADPRIKFAVCNGTPLRHTFNPDTTFGLNPVLAHGLMCVFNVRHPLFLMGITRALSKRGDELLNKPSAPILAMDGDEDSVVDTRDTVLLGQAPGNRLILIKNDDHCGLFHYERMVHIIFLWMRQQLKL